MNILIWLVAGAVVGVIAGMVFGRHPRQGPLLNIVVGTVGAVLAGWLVSPLVGLPAANEGRFTWGALAVALVGAVLLLIAVNVVRRNPEN
jgi:uncharacterized membrane protein YeaQ/YmgE (transglycosylase-associated protein family)